MAVHRAGKLALLCLGLLLLVGQAFAASIYVAPTGSDTTGNGTIGSPYATLWKASTVAVAGDTVYARGGTYVTRTPQNGANVIVCSGAAGNPITFTNYPGEFPIFDGAAASGWAAGDAIFIIASSQHIVFQGFEIRNTPYTVKAHGLLFWECDDVLVKNCKVHDLGACGINFIGHDMTAEGNEGYNLYMLNQGGGSSSGWGCGFKSEMGESAGYITPTNITFRNNYVHETWGEAVNVLYSNGFLVEGNTVVNSFSVSIYADNAKNGIIRNNLVYTTPENEHRRSGMLPDGILLASERYTGWTEVPNSNIQIYNNLVYRVKDGIAFWKASNSYNNLKIYHNTVGPGEGRGFFIDSGGTAPNELKNNIIYGTCSIANPSVWVTSYNCWPNGVPSGSHPNSFAANPLLVNPVGTDIPNGWKLTGSSPCINYGTSVGVTTDFWGTARDANPDLGFHEYGGGGPQPPVANFTGNPTSGTAPLAVMFTDSSTNSPTSWSWNFGDSSTSTAQNPSHTYSAGTFTVSLRATNVAGYDDEVKTNYISVGSGGNPPVANFTGNPTSGTAPLAVSFTDTSTNSPTSWSWTFGDGGTSTAQNPSHTYNSAGQYTVALTATNAYGSNTNTKTNYITVNQPQGQDYFCSSYTAVNGPYVSGDHTSVHASDNVYLVHSYAGSYKGIRLDFTFTTGLGSLSSLSCAVESKLSTGTQTLTVYLYNYSTSAWVSQGTSTLTTSDTTFNATPASPGNYISGGTVKLRVQVGPKSSPTYNYMADLVKITAAP